MSGRELVGQQLPLGLAAIAWLAGACMLGTSHWPSSEILARFNAAGPIAPELDASYHAVPLPATSAYRIGDGDLLQVTVRRRFGSAAEDAPVRTRVDAKGNLSLPLVGQIPSRGLTLAQLEQHLTAALHPRYLRNRPTVVAELVDANRQRVAVVGAVQAPGVHDLRSDQLTLFDALAAAGGIIRGDRGRAGAHRIRVRQPEGREQATVSLPVRGMDVPHTNLRLSGGETVEVERWSPALFTVVGLVRNPGAFEYPPGAAYNLMQALAIAGGVDPLAAPPYATVFRTEPSGEILPVTFSIHGADLVQASSIEIRPGDVIAVQHTVGSWTRSLLAAVTRMQVNFLVDPFDTR